MSSGSLSVWSFVPSEFALYLALCGSGEVAQQRQQLPCKCENSSSDPKNPRKSQTGVKADHNPSQRSGGGGSIRRGSCLDSAAKLGKLMGRGLVRTTAVVNKVESD